MTKLEKIGADLERARTKQATWTQRVKDLEARYREEENTMIHSMVHAANLTPEQLGPDHRAGNQRGCRPLPRTVE